MSEQQPSPVSDPQKEKYLPPTDPSVTQQVEDALSGLDVDAMVADAGRGQSMTKLRGLQSGIVERINLQKDEVFINLGGKAQGVMPFSQFEAEPRVRDVVEVMIERFDPREGLYICAKKGAAQSSTDWDSLSVGAVVEGLVNGMNKGGLEVKIGQNIRAFMPLGQIDIEFHKDVSVFLSQRLTVEITQLEKESKRCVVSRRKVLERERAELKEKLSKEIEEGQTRSGTVRSVTDFGAFVDLGGMDGLIHISEMTYNRQLKPKDIVNVGDKVEVKILKFDRTTGKVALSLKQSMNDPWKDVDSKYPVGTKVTARVVKLENFGAFIEVEDGVQGLLPLSEMSWQRIRNPKDVVQIGQTIPLVVIAVDPAARRMTFSLKQATPDPWSEANGKYPKHSIHEGTVLRLAEFGAFIELEKNVEGLAHVSELADRRVGKPADVVKVGDKVKVRVLDVDPAQRRISLSLRQTDGSFTAPPEPVKKPEKKRKIPLRGGLDF
ncbi:MAG: S1 RNA-binding domain-containing protein [Tepidisphaeraceae bacterium]